MYKKNKKYKYLESDKFIIGNQYFILMFLVFIFVLVLLNFFYLIKAINGVSIKFFNRKK